MYVYIYIYIYIHTTYYAQNATLAEDGKSHECVAVCDVDLFVCPILRNGLLSVFCKAHIC